MKGLSWILLLLVGVTPLRAGAADASLAGNWQLVLHLSGQSLALGVVELQNKDGAWSGNLLDTDRRFGKETLATVQVDPDFLHLTLKGDVPAKFEGKPTKGGKAVLGSVDLGGRVYLADLKRTSLKTLKPKGDEKDTYASDKDESGVAAIEDMTKQLVKESKEGSADDLRKLSDKFYQAAIGCGPQYQRQAALDLARLLTPRAETAPIAVEYARQAEKLVTDQDGPAMHKIALSAVAGALRGAGKTDEATEVEARNEKIDWVKITPFSGQKDASRTVLVELFTGAECPPCVAADIAFDSLTKTYQPADVVLLEYHLHIPGPDPMTNPATVARQKYYGKAIQGTPTTVFDGKRDGGSGGGFVAGQNKYDTYTKIIDEHLKKAGAAKVNVEAAMKDGKIDIHAQASDATGPADKLRLRLVLVEEQVHYVGGNTLPVSHHVVRAFPGGTEGMALKDGVAKQSVTVDLNDLRKELTQYLDESAKKRAFPRKDRPMDFKDLHVVALVQNDENKEVLQAVVVPVTTPAGSN